MSATRIAFSIFLMTLFFSIYVFAQEHYYYFSGKKVGIVKRDDRFVIEFRKGTSSSERTYLLYRYGLDPLHDVRYSNYVLVQTQDFVLERMKEIKSNRFVEDVHSVYRPKGKTTEFAVLNRIIVKLKENDPALLNSLIFKYNLEKIERKWAGRNTYLLRMMDTNSESALQIANKIYESGLVEFCHPDFLTFNALETNDTYYSSQWNLSRISMAAAWNITTGSPSVIIAVVDNGVDSDHPDLDDNLITGYDVVDDDSTTDPYDNHAHGTACAGIAAAETNNGIGIAGVGYNCKIMPVQATHTDAISSIDLATAIYWAAANGSDIINISHGVVEADEVNDAIDYVTTHGRGGKGCIIVKSAGNRGSGGITFPGEHPKVIAVGATDQNDNRLPYSSYGSALDVMAPSGWAADHQTSIHTTDITGNNGYNFNNPLGENVDLTDKDYTKWFDGTSAAAPHVSGLACLILSLDSLLTEEEVRKIICYTAEDKGSAGWDQYYGWGRINALDAVLAASGQVTTSGYLQRNEVWWQDDISLTGNVIVPDGMYLRIVKCATVNLNGNYIKCTGSGKIIKQGTVTGYKHYVTSGSDYKGFYPASYDIVDLVENAESGWNIHLDSGTYYDGFDIPAGVTLTGKGKNATTIYYGVSFYNADNAAIYDLTVNNRISVTNSDNVEIGVKLATASGYIDLSNSSVTVHDLVATNSRFQGIYAHNTSSLDLFGGQMENKGAAVYLYESTNALVEAVDFCENTLDIDAAWGCSADAYGCTFSSDEEGGSVEGNVYWDSWSSCGGGGDGEAMTATVSGLRKVNAAVSAATQDLPAFRAAREALRQLRLQLRDERRSGQKVDLATYRKQMAMVLGQFKQVVSAVPGESVAAAALGYVVSCYRLLGDSEELERYLQSVVDQRNLKGLRPYALSALSGVYAKQRNYDQALALAEQVITYYPKSDLSAEMLYQQGIIYKHGLKQPEKARALFARVVSEWPDHPTARSARAELESLDKRVSPETLAAEELLRELHLSGYPNPFNPVTTLSYRLPEAGHVRLRVYDLQGRLVATLVDGRKEAGSYRVQWDASSLASGVYFGKLEFGGRVLTQKLLLVR